MSTKSTATVSSMTAIPKFDERAFRNAMGSYASGITVITSDAKNPVGMTCQSFFSLSLDPPLIAVAVGKASNTYPAIRSHGRFCVNVLASNQEWISTQFAKRADRWRDVRWQASPRDSPILDGSVMWIDCELHAEHEAGDHVIVVGLVENVGTAEHNPTPLLYYRGKYARVSGAEEQCAGAGDATNNVK